MRGPWPCFHDFQHEWCAAVLSAVGAACRRGGFESTTSHASFASGPVHPGCARYCGRRTRRTRVMGTHTTRHLLQSALLGCVAALGYASGAGAGGTAQPSARLARDHRRQSDLGQVEHAACRSRPAARARTATPGRRRSRRRAARPSARQAAQTAWHRRNTACRCLRHRHRDDHHRRILDRHHRGRHRAFAGADLQDMLAREPGIQVHQPVRRRQRRAARSRHARLRRHRAHRTRWC